MWEKNINEYGYERRIHTNLILFILLSISTYLYVQCNYDIDH